MPIRLRYLSALALLGASHPYLAQSGGVDPILQDGFEARLLQGPIIDWIDIYNLTFPLPDNDQRILQVPRGRILSIRLQTPKQGFNGSSYGFLQYGPLQAGSLATVSLSPTPGDFDPVSVGVNCLREGIQDAVIAFTTPDTSGSNACVLQPATQYYFNIHVGTGATPDESGAACAQETCQFIGGARVG